LPIVVCAPYAQTIMSIDPGSVRRPIRELRKSLKHLPSDAPEKDVHSLRTRARRIAAISAALVPDDSPNAQRLLKALKPLRKAAGEVRNFDVLANEALALVGHCRRSSLEKLVEHLIFLRIQAAGKLLVKLRRRRKEVRRRLKRFSKRIEGELRVDSPQAGPASRIAEQLSRWPAFDGENLHAFRVHVKELGYILQLAQNADPSIVKALDKVKSRIGEWHDWHELERFARKVLDPIRDRDALKVIAETQKLKFVRAIHAAQSLRTQYLGAHGTGITEP